jgi:receptor expression-enhancing protein 5/6
MFSSHTFLPNFRLFLTTTFFQVHQSFFIFIFIANYYFSIKCSLLQEMGMMGSTKIDSITASKSFHGQISGTVVKHGGAPSSVGFVQKIKDTLTDPELEQSLRQIKIVSLLADRFNITATLLVFGTALTTTFLMLFVITGFSLTTLVDILAFVYPVYMSYKAVQSVDVNDDKQWLTYWVVYGFLKLAEEIFFLDYLIPFYFLFKFVFLFYCAFYKGAGVVFKVWFQIYGYLFHLINLVNASTVLFALCQFFCFIFCFVKFQTNNR